MRKLYLLILFLALSAGAFAQNYTILGSASPLSSCNCFRITPDAGDQHGAIFQNQTINLNNSFDFTFNIFLGCGGSGGADGIVFVLTSNPNGLGSAGEGLGYAGPSQPYSLAVEFDTWQNGGAGDPGSDHIGIESGGQYNHNVAPPVSALASGGNIDNCAWHTARIVWDVNTHTFSVYLDGVLRQSINIPNMLGSYFGGNPIVNWGWSGATGGGTNDQQVCVLSTSNWVAGTNYQSCNLTMQFNDISTSNLGNVQSWAWTFGDGGTSALQNPTHTYATTGTYNVTLTITDISGCTTSYAHTITINPPITLAPTLTDPPCNGGLNGSLSVTPSGGFGIAAGYGGYTYNWNGGASFLQSYNGGAGTYNVVVTDGVCSATGQYTLNQPTALSASTSHQDASCGANNGSVTINITGGTPGYVGVNWAGQFSGTTVTGMAPGFYIADFHDANGCSALLQYSETVGSGPCGITSSVTTTNVTCYGGSNGTATLTVVGTIGTANITWSNGSVGATATGLLPGTHTYNYSDGLPAHNFSGTVSITQPGAPMVASITTIDMSCAGTNDGQALASVNSGGQSPYTYSWSNAGSGASVSNLSAGPISVSINDANGCSAVASGTITGPPTLTLNVTKVDDSCYLSKTGSAMANAGGGNPPFTYFWSNISSAQNNLSLGIGTYTVTVTDSKNCTITGSASISQPTPFSHTLTSQNLTCNGVSTGSITVTPSGGSPAYNYAWNPSTASGGNPTGLAAGQYNLTLTDAHNCTRLDSVVLTQPATPLSVVASHTDVNCYNANDGTLTITVGGGTPPYTYQGNPVPPGTTTLPGLAAGNYTGTVTDANGCAGPVNETIIQPQPQSLTTSSTNNVCAGGNIGTATANFINPTGSVVYNWSNNQTGPNISGLTANTYTVTATDTKSCSLTGTATVTEPPAVSMTATPVDAVCFGGNGSATANPTPAGTYTYVWSSGGGTTQTVSLPAGSYTVTASDANSCNQTAAVTINQATDIVIQETHTNLDCFGDADGDIQLTVTGGTGPNYTYNWNPNVSTTNIAGNLVAGIYAITVTDQAACTKTASVTLTQPTQPLTLNVQSTNIPCYGQTNGSINITATGGTPGYTYSWNPNVSTTNSATGLSPNTYSITVTDVNGCSSIPTITISQPSQPLTLTTSQTNLTCFQNATGTADVVVSGGTFPYTYAWTNNVSTTPSATGLAAGNYTVTVTDNNTCTNSTNYTLTEPALLAGTETHVDVLCFGDATGSIDITATGGTLPYVYAWTPNVSTTNTATALTAGAYSVLITDSNNCTATTPVTVSEPALLTLNAVPADVLCNGGNTGSINATAAGGTLAYSFSATDGNNNYTSANGQFGQLAMGTYTVSVTDNHACVTTATAVVNEPAPLVDVVSVFPATCYHYTDGRIEVATTGGVTAYNYTFSGGGSNNSGIFNAGAGTYTVTMTDANGCSLVETGTITEPDSVLISVSPTPIEMKLGESIQLSTTTNQSASITYDWAPNFGLSCYDCANPVFNGIYSQPYFVTAITSDGCRGTGKFVVTVIPNYDVFFPNAFTPNGDGINDEWQMFGNQSAIKQVHVVLFNRIGEKVFETNDINFRWDGSFKGTIGEGTVGVYVYHAQIVWLNNHSDGNYKGTVTLLK